MAECELSKLGFSGDTYGETIIAFLNDNGDIINVMPMGFKLGSNCELVGRIFRGSLIYDVITKNSIDRLRCTVCITTSPQPFYLAVFNKKVLIRRFRRSNCPRSYCDACINGELVVKGIEGDVINVVVRPLSIRISRRVPRVFNRAFPAIIEALVWYTKIPYVPCDDVYKILRRIEMCVETVNRASINEELLNIISTIHRMAVRNAEGLGCRSGDKDL